MAFINMVQAVRDYDGRSREFKQQQRISKEGNRPVQYVNGLPVIPYGTGVVLDSGALDHMTGNRALLTEIHEFFVQVMMPDGFVVNCCERRTMRLLVTDPKTGKECVVPLLDTLLVEGIHSHLVSTPSLNESGVVA